MTTVMIAAIKGKYINHSTGINVVRLRKLSINVNKALPTFPFVEAWDKAS